MNGYYVSVVALTLYKFSILAAGVLFAAMGYKLFFKGVYEKAGDLKAVWGGGKSLMLKQAAPGTFFALFGCVIICFALFQKSEATSTDVTNLIQKESERQSQFHQTAYSADSENTNTSKPESRQMKQAPCDTAPPGDNLDGVAKRTNTIVLHEHDVRRGRGAKIQENQYQLTNPIQINRDKTGEVRK